jgi:16S rRNA (guanine966-N2)-methyltransferase
VAGVFGGRTLNVPSSGTRPTSDRVREAIFSKLAHDGVIANGRVIDFFAGSGAFGLEALSRGARFATLVDSGKSAVKVLNENANALDVLPQVRIVADDAVRFSAALSRGGGLFGANLRIAPAGGGNPELAQALLSQAADRALNLIFLDPPYDYPETELAKILENLVRCGLLASDAVIVVERSTRGPAPLWPAGLTQTDHKTYGETAVYYAMPASEQESLQ